MPDIPLPHSNLDRFLPKTGNPEFDREIGLRLQAAQQNFEELATRTAKQLESVLQQRVPPGTVVDFAVSTPPTGYLACDGSAVSRNTFADLFAAIGTDWGAGDGSTTFNLPNYNDGRMLRGNSSPGGTGGANTHGHSVTTVVSVSGNTGAAAGAFVLDANFGTGSDTIPLAAHTHSVTAAGSGGGTADSQSNVPAYRDVFKIIKV